MLFQRIKFSMYGWIVRHNLIPFRLLFNANTE